MGTADTASQTRSVPGGTETILLVEDEPGVRSLAQSMLTRLGYRVLDAGTAEEAIQLADAHDGAIDLLLTDLVLPAMNGRELAEAIGSGRPGLRCLYMSGYTEDIVIRHGVLTAQIAFLQKPFTSEALAEQVRAALDA